MNFTIVELIQAMLAPGIMISACGLLLLGMNNKYSLVATRIRTLDEEKRKINIFKMERELDKIENLRLKSIESQLKNLNFRFKLVRNTVICYSFAMGMFIFSSLFIGLKILTQYEKHIYIIIPLFLLGMFCVLGGVIYSALEVCLGYKIIQFETNAEI